MFQISWQQLYPSIRLLKSASFNESKSILLKHYFYHAHTTCIQVSCLNFAKFFPKIFQVRTRCISNIFSNSAGILKNLHNFNTLDYENLGIENMFSKLQRLLLYYETTTFLDPFPTIIPQKIFTLQSCEQKRNPKSSTCNA